MKKMFAALAGTMALAYTSPVAAQVGPCAASAGPSIQVNITGLKNRSGNVRVRLFPADSKKMFDKKFALQRIEFSAPKSGAIAFCVAVPRAGNYVVDIRHDVNLNGKTDRSDGVGASGNPSVSMLDVIMGNKPPLGNVQVKVGAGSTATTISVKYR